MNQRNTSPKAYILNVSAFADIDSGGRNRRVQRVCSSGCPTAAGVTSSSLAAPTKLPCRADASKACRDFKRVRDLMRFTIRAERSARKFFFLSGSTRLPREPLLGTPLSRQGIDEIFDGA